MNYQEFTRRLDQAQSHTDPQIRYILGYMFEMLNEQQKQLTQCAQLLDAMSDSVMMQSQLTAKSVSDITKAIEGRVKTDGVEVHSMQPDPDDD